MRIRLLVVVTGICGLACAGPAPIEVIPPLQVAPQPAAAPAAPAQPPMDVEAVRRKVQGLPQSWIPVEPGVGGWFVQGRCGKVAPLGFDLAPERPALVHGADVHPIERVASNRQGMVFTVGVGRELVLTWEDRALKVARWSFPDGSDATYVVAELAGGLPVRDDCEAEPDIQ